MRPGRSGLVDNASEERTGLCSFRVDALFRARPFLSVVRTVPGPDHLGPFAAGWRLLSGCAPATHSSARQAALQAPLRRSRLPAHHATPHRPQTDSPPTLFKRAPRLLQLSTDSRLQTGPLGVSARLYMESVRRGFNLSPPTSDPPLAPPLLAS